MASKKVQSSLTWALQGRQNKDSITHQPCCHNQTRTSQRIIRQNYKRSIKIQPTPHPAKILHQFKKKRQRNKITTRIQIPAQTLKRSTPMALTNIKPPLTQALRNIKKKKKTQTQSQTTFLPKSKQKQN
jgi:hypothetical protein